jgi:Sulfotransferase family
MRQAHQNTDMSGASGDPGRYIFIVGLPRTGSTLTHRILNRSSHVRLAGETHFLGAPSWPRAHGGYGQQFARTGDLRTQDGLQRVVDAIYGMGGKSFWSRFARTVERTEFERCLRASDRSERALFETTLRTYAMGRPIAGDKTPEHIYSVPTLLSWFPNAKVVHTFRDPRAIYVSLRRKERDEALTALGRAARRTGPAFEIYASTSLAVRWRRMAALHRHYAREYPGRYLLLKFEDLIADAESVTRHLCAFVGIPFEPDMLQQVVHNSSYIPKEARAGIDQSAAQRWRRHLPAVTERWLLALCGAQLPAFGYDR